MHEAYLTLFFVVCVLCLLAFTRIPADVVLMAALGGLLIFGVLSPSDAFAGFANTGLMTIALLYIVAAGLKETGSIQFIGQRMLGQPTSVRQAQARLLFPIASLSAFMNNTAVVAMLIPAVQEWAQRIKIPVSKLLLPLSYVAIMGGTVTLIGTSTNLVIDGLLQKEVGISLGMCDLAWVGIPVLFVGAVYLFVLGPWLLPARDGAVEQFDNAREYTVEVEITPASPLVGKTIVEAGLRNLTYTYLA